MPDDSVAIGELFPADDLVAQWVFQLTAVSEDLATADRLLTDALRRDDPPHLTNYHYRQVIARVFEANRPIVALESNPEISEWFDKLPSDKTTNSAITLLRALYLPAGSSLADSAYRRARNIVVHHSRIGSDLARNLRAAADQQAWCALDWDAMTITYEWPSAASVHLLSGGLDDPDLQHFTTLASITKTIPDAFATVAQTALGHYSDRVGIDPNRFTRHVGVPKR